MTDIRNFSASLWAVHPLFDSEVLCFCCALNDGCISSHPSVQQSHMLLGTHPVQKVEIAGIVTDIRRKDEYNLYLIDDGSGFPAQVRMMTKTFDGTPTAMYAPKVSQAVVVTGSIQMGYSMVSSGGLRVREVRALRIHLVQSAAALMHHWLRTAQLWRDEYCKPLSHWLPPWALAALPGQAAAVDSAGADAQATGLQPAMNADGMYVDDDLPLPSSRWHRKAMSALAKVNVPGLMLPGVHLPPHAAVQLTARGQAEPVSAASSSSSLPSSQDGIITALALALATRILVQCHPYGRWEQARARADNEKQAAALTSRLGHLAGVGGAHTGRVMDNGAAEPGSDAVMHETLPDQDGAGGAGAGGADDEDEDGMATDGPHDGLDENGAGGASSGADAGAGASRGPTGRHVTGDDYHGYLLDDDYADRYADEDDENEEEDDGYGDDDDAASQQGPEDWDDPDYEFGYGHGAGTYREAGRARGAAGHGSSAKPMNTGGGDRSRAGGSASAAVVPKKRPRLGVVASDRDGPSLSRATAGGGPAYVVPSGHCAEAGRVGQMVTNTLQHGGWVFAEVGDDEDVDMPDHEAEARFGSSSACGRDYTGGHGPTAGAGAGAAASHGSGAAMSFPSDGGETVPVVDSSLPASVHASVGAVTLTEAGAGGSDTTAEMADGAARAHSSASSADAALPSYTLPTLFNAADVLEAMDSVEASLAARVRAAAAAASCAAGVGAGASAAGASSPSSSGAFNTTGHPDDAAWSCINSCLDRLTSDGVLFRKPSDTPSAEAAPPWLKEFWAEEKERTRKQEELALGQAGAAGAGSSKSTNPGSNRGFGDFHAYGRGFDPRLGLQLYGVVSMHRVLIPALSCSIKWAAEMTMDLLRHDVAKRGRAGAGKASGAAAGAGGSSGAASAGAGASSSSAEPPLDIRPSELYIRQSLIIDCLLSHYPELKSVHPSAVQTAIGKLEGDGVIAKATGVRPGNIIARMRRGIEAMADTGAAGTGAGPLEDAPPEAVTDGISSSNNTGSNDRELVYIVMGWQAHAQAGASAGSGGERAL